MLIVSVHGTGDNSSVVDTPRWWQRNSTFMRQYSSHFAEAGQEVDIVPFVWSGANSERDRRAAGVKLARVLSKYEQEGHSYHLLGHSHGGSVIEAALVHLIARRWQTLSNLQSITTIGTPFLTANRKRISLRRFTHVVIRPWWWIPSLLIFCALAVVLARTDDTWLDMLEVWTQVFLEIETSTPLQISSLVFGLFTLIAIPRLVWSVLFSRSMLSRREMEQLATATESLRHHLWHAEDEAIGALRGASRARLSIFSQVRLSSLLASPISTLLLVATLLLFTAAAISSSALYPVFSFGDSGWLSNPGKTLAEAAQPLIMMSQTWFVRAAGITTANLNDNAAAETVIWMSWLARLCLFSALLLAVLAMMSRLLDRPYRAVVGRALDALVSGRVRGGAFGADVGWIAISGAGHKPSYVQSEHPPLPQPIADEMTVAVEQGAHETLRKLRSDLGSALYAANDFDPLTVISARLTWRELLHTMYFSSPAFVEYLTLATIAIGNGARFAREEARPTCWTDVDER